VHYNTAIICPTLSTAAADDEIMSDGINRYLSTSPKTISSEPGKHTQWPQSECTQIRHKNVNSFPSHKSGSTDLCFLSPQLDGSLHCKTTGTGLVHRMVCLFMP